VKEGRILPLY